MNVNPVQALGVPDAHESHAIGLLCALVAQALQVLPWIGLEWGSSLSDRRWVGQYADALGAVAAHEGERKKFAM